MGMASSQARLLQITARMHDVEFQAQNIMNAKIQLATEKDDVYEDYLAALDATKLQVAFIDDKGASYYQDVTYESLCTYNPDRRMQYGIKDSRTGKSIVDRETYEVYNEYDNDKYSFAWRLLGLDDDAFGPNNDGKFVGYCPYGEAVGDQRMLMTDAEGTALMHFIDENPESAIAQKYAKYLEAEESGDEDKIREAMNEFRDEVYTGKDSTTYINEIFQVMNGDNDGEGYKEIELDEFNYYVHMFEGIKANGGCICMDTICEDGEIGKEWFNNMLESGSILIDVYIPTGTHKGWTETSESTSTNQNYLQRIHDDAAEKKAEAIYNHELDIINRKDKSFDQDLKKLETEENACKTELDSIKKVIQDNTERTFGIFS